MVSGRSRLPGGTSSVVAGLLTEPQRSTAGLNELRETFGRRPGSVRRPATTWLTSLTHGSSSGTHSVPYLHESPACHLRTHDRACGARRNVLRPQRRSLDSPKAGQRAAHDL